MKYFEVRDVVRENVGRDKIAQHILDFSMQRGLREIEKAGNFYWMRGVKNFNTVIGQHAYSITTDLGGGLNLPNWRGSRILLTSDQTLPNPDWDEVFGPIDMEEAGLEFADTDNGMPVIYSIDEDVDTGTLVDPLSNSTPPRLLLWPNLPDKVFAMRWHYYQWTSLPADVTSERHEVLIRWPEALIYTATEYAIVALTKDPNFGIYWHQKFDNPGNKQDPGELTKIRRYDQDRQRDSRVELRPSRGPLMSRRQRWRRNREIWI